MTETCYMCDEEGTTKEHAPPISFFPDQESFLSIGIEIEDMRKNLIRVPSCPKHNTGKSGDDVFARNILVMNQGTNDVGQNQFRAKVLRAFKRDSSLLAQFQIDTKPVILTDGKGTFETNAMTGDVDRFNSWMDKLGRALY